MGLPLCLFMILLNLLIKYQLFNFTILEIPEMEFQTISIFEYRKKNTVLCIRRFSINLSISTFI